MKISLLLLMWALSDYRSAVPGYKFSFPRDHFNHPEFQTEWWYYTGNLRIRGRQTVRIRIDLLPSRDSAQPSCGIEHMGCPRRLDGSLRAQRYRWKSVLSHRTVEPSGPGIAGVDAGQGLIWNGNWSVKWSGDDQKLNALANGFEVDLMLRSVKPPVVHGTEGISRKAAGPGRASHYISLTRLITKGGIKSEVGNSQWRVSPGWTTSSFRIRSSPIRRAGIGLVSSSITAQS